MILLGCSARARFAGLAVVGARGASTTAAGARADPLRPDGGNVPLIIAANLAFAISPALYWTAARRFSRRRRDLCPHPGGRAPARGLVDDPGHSGSDPSGQMALGLAINADLFLRGGDRTVDAAGRSGSSRAGRWSSCLPSMRRCLPPASIEALAGTFPAMELVPLGSWFGLIHFESIVFSIGTAVFVIAFIRERGEARQRTAAETDPLTGVSTRRALLEQAEEALRRCQATDAPLSLVVFDLDRFKSINDRFGHPVGDAVLRRFGDTVRAISARRSRRAARRRGVRAAPAGDEPRRRLRRSPSASAPRSRADCRSVDGQGDRRHGQRRRGHGASGIRRCSRC